MYTHTFTPYTHTHIHTTITHPTHMPRTHHHLLVDDIIVTRCSNVVCSQKSAAKCPWDAEWTPWRRHVSVCVWAVYQIDLHSTSVWSIKNRVYWVKCLSTKSHYRQSRKTWRFVNWLIDCRVKRETPQKSALKERQDAIFYGYFGRYRLYLGFACIWRHFGLYIPSSLRLMSL